MFRHNWRDAAFWRWWWHERVTFESRIAVYVFCFALLLGGGLFAADRLASAGAEVAPSTPIMIETTVQRLVTVRERGRIVRKLVPVVERVRVKSRPVVETRRIGFGFECPRATGLPVEGPTSSAPAHGERRSKWSRSAK